jgi:hypothetical protein
MDEPNHQTPRSGNGDLPTDESAAPRRAASQDDSTVAYYGDAERVREGFAIALGLLGLSTPMVNDATQAQSEDGE